MPEEVKKRTFQLSRSAVGTVDEAGVNSFTFSATCYTMQINNSM